MTISAQRFATKTRTWLLIAGLTALLVGIGALIGGVWLLIAGLTALLVGIGALIGGVWLYVFVALAVAMNVGGYWFSDRLALPVSRANRVEPGTRPNLEVMVQDLARRAELPAPRLYTIPRSSRTRSRRAATLGTPRSRSPRAWVSLAALEPAV